MNEDSTGKAQMRLRAQAALDGELDAGHALQFERDLANDPALRAYYEKLAMTREAIRSGAPREAAPDALRARILDLVDSPAPRAPPRARVNRDG